jgi:YfiH family protein
MKYKRGNFLGIPFIYLEELNLNGFIYGFTTREISKEEVLKKFADSGLILFTTNQIHSSKVIKVDRRSVSEETADGLLTNEEELFIGVKTADCLPIILIDRDNRAVGAIHAGWRGTFKGVAMEGIKRMEEIFGSNPHDLIAILGPSISVCCYEIGEDVKEVLENSFLESILERERKFYFDLRKANKVLLQKGGIKERNIYEISLCTMCNRELFFSHRRGEKGRNIAFVGIYKENRL